MQQERSYSEETAHAVDGEVHSLVEHAFARAIAILERNRALLDRTAAELLKTETLNQPEIELLKHEISGEPSGSRAPLPSPRGQVAEATGEDSKADRRSARFAETQE